MPLPIVLYIISFLDIMDVANLSQVNCFFHEMTSNDIIWEELFFKHNNEVTEELVDLALEKGWKHIFFANKLHLRVSVGLIYSRNALKGIIFCNQSPWKLF